MPHLRIISASVSGHTEYVLGVLKEVLAKHAESIEISEKRAELADASDLLEGDVLLLACGTWNTGGAEGQLSPYMHQLLRERAKDVDLSGKPVTFVSLGDERYRYTARVTERFVDFAKEHNGDVFLPPLVIVNEPYGQEKTVREWGEKLVKALGELAVAS